MEKNKLGGAIRREREKKGISQEKLAEQLNVSRQAVSKWETGLSLPTEENLRRLEQSLALEVGALLAWREADLPAVPSKRSWSGVMAGALAAVVVGFLAGRLTAPQPPPVPEEPQTKTIWRPVEHSVTDGEAERTERIAYNEMGCMLRREVKEMGEVYLQEAEYDEMGNQIAYRSYNPDGSLYYADEMEYDEMGNRLLVRRLNGAGELEFWVEEAFDEHGEQIRYQKFNAQGEIERSERWVHTYFEDGSHQVDYFYPSVNESEPMRIVELDDPYDNILSIVRYDVDGNVVETSTWTYQSFEVPIDFTPEY